MRNEIIPKSDADSYRLTLFDAHKKESIIPLDKRAVYMSRVGLSFSHVFIEHSLLSELSDNSTVAVLDHIQYMLSVGELFPTKKTILDNYTRFSPETMKALSAVFGKAFGSMNRSYEHVRHDLKFLLELDVVEASCLMSLDDIWSLWRKNRTKAIKSYLQDVKNRYTLYSRNLWKYAMREEFFPGHFDDENIGDELIHEFRLKELSTCESVLSSTSSDGVFFHYNVKSTFILKLASEILNRFKAGYLNQEKDLADRERIRFFSKHLMVYLPNISFYAVHYLKTICDSEKEMIEHVRNASIYEIFCLMSPSSLPRKKERREEFLRFVDDFIIQPPAMGYEDYDEFGSVLRLNGFTGLLKNELVEELTGTKVPDRRYVCMVSSGSYADTNYVMALIANNFGVEELGIMISYVLSFPEDRRKELPTIAQWERLVRLQDGDIGQLPLEMGIQMVSRKRV